MTSPTNLSTIAAGTGGFVINGEAAGDQSGFSVSSAGDINGDGFDDLIIGAYAADPVGETDAGKSYVVFGKADGFGDAINLSAIAAGTGGFVINGEAAGDASGRSVSAAGDVNGDGFDDLIIGAYGADPAGGTTAGKSYVIFGKASGFGASVNLSTIAAGTGGFVINGEAAGDQSGFSVSSAGDINGDGFDDLIVGANYADPASAAYAGKSYVVFGKASGFGAAVNLSAVAAGTGGFVINGESKYDSAGSSVSSAGDINGDGLDDLVIAAPDSLKSYVVFGTSSGFGASLDLSAIAAGTGGFVLDGKGSGGGFVSSVSSAGDINGDGLDDLIVGAPDAVIAGGSVGRSYVVFGQYGGFGASVKLSTIATGAGGFVINGEATGDQSGTSVSAAGDVNGDGFDDLIIGAYKADPAGGTDAGKSYVVFGKASGFGASVNLSTIAAGTGGFVINGEASGDQSGFSVSAAGDVNGDGFDDLIVGARKADTASGTNADAGKSYVIFGQDSNPAAPINLSTIAAGTGGFVINGEAAGDASGFSVSSAGDVNGDGFDDLIIGASGADPAGKSDAGKSYVVFGKASGFGASVNLSTIAAGTGGFVINGESKYDSAGSSVSSAGDINGDGFDDLIVGAPNGSLASAAYAGKSYVVFGKASGFGAAVNLSTVAAGTGGFVINGESAYGSAGFAVSAAGDINGDGLDDLVIAAPAIAKSYVVFGTSSGFGASLDLSAIAAGTGGFVLDGRGKAGVSAVSVSSVSSAGDINGDGLDDLIVGAPLAVIAGSVVGKSYVVFGQYGGFGASVTLSTIASGAGGFVINGEASGGQSGTSVSAAGDVNGDGFDDLIIGAYKADPAGGTDAGKSYVVFGKASGFGASVNLSTIAAGTGGFVINGEAAGDQSGFSVSAAGDVNGDGFDDLIVGAHKADTASGTNADAGKSYVAFGKSSGFGAAVDLATIAAGIGGFVINGVATGDQSGFSVSAAGDINGDGFDDLVVGADGADPAGKSDAGKSYVIFGHAFNTIVTTVGTTSADTMNGTAVADDLVGGRGNDTLSGGHADVLIGGIGSDRLVVSALNFRRIDGGAGADTLALSGAGLTLDLNAIADTRLRNVETIDLTGTGNNSLTVSRQEVLRLSSTTNTLTVEGDAGDTLDLGAETWTKGATASGHTTYTNGQATLSVGISLTIACFAAGTRIETDTGQIAVETLRVGDMVRLATGGTRPVRWIGWRHLDLTRHANPGLARPVRIMAGAFGVGLPARDLRLSPDHALFIDGVLIPARLLINHATIVEDATCDTVTYYHIELDAHDVLLAEGLPAESYLDTGNRGLFENAGLPLTLHPDLSGQEGRVAASCAPFVDAPDMVRPIWVRLAERADELGIVAVRTPVTQDPEPVVIADGRVLRPILAQAERYLFVLPAGSATVRLVSRASVPNAIQPWVEDRRRLGLLVRCIRVTEGALVTDLPLDHPNLTQGWWAVEPGPSRWTDGDAVLQLGAGGLRVLEIKAGCLPAYLATPSDSAAAA